MKKYRVVEKDGSYYPQRRIVQWVPLKESVNCTTPISYNTCGAAKAAIINEDSKGSSPKPNIVWKGYL